MIWKPINVYTDKYLISDTGLVKHKRTNRILKPDIGKYGYARVTLYKNNREHKKFLVHRLVASVFLDNINNLPEVNHLDKNKLNNNVNNLEWCTSSENTRHARGKAVIMYNEDMQLIKEFSCIVEAAKYTKIDGTSISRCCLGTQKHAGDYIWRYKQEVEV